MSNVLPGDPIFLPYGRQAIVTDVFPRMNVARIRTVEGQVRTVKLSDVRKPEVVSTVLRGKPPQTISDYLAAQIAADSVPAKDRLIALLRKEFKVMNVDDKFLKGRRDKAGYPSANVQVQLADGNTAEVQIVPREVQEITDS